MAITYNLYKPTVKSESLMIIMMIIHLPISKDQASGRLNSLKEIRKNPQETIKDLKTKRSLLNAKRQMDIYLGQCAHRAHYQSME